MPQEDDGEKTCQPLELSCFSLHFSIQVLWQINQKSKILVDHTRITCITRHAIELTTIFSLNLD